MANDEDEFEDESKEENEDESDEEEESEEVEEENDQEQGKVAAASGTSITDILIYLIAGIIVIAIALHFLGINIDFSTIPSTVIGLIIFAALVGILLILSIQTLRPSQRGLIERLGKYNRFANPGLNIIIPLLEKMIKVNITEQLVETDKREIITKDSLNAIVDAQVYFKVKDDEKSVKASQYNVFNYRPQIVQLAVSTLRNNIGTMNFVEANSQRNKLNDALAKQLQNETKNWGIEIVRTELKQIQPPSNVQDAMNQVITAEQRKTAAVNFANAVETEADGKRRAAIKEAEGIQQATILEAKGQAEAIKVVNEAARKYFKGNAQKLKSLEVTQASLQNGTKIIFTDKKRVTAVINDTAGTVIPTSEK